MFELFVVIVNVLFIYLVYIFFKRRYMGAIHSNKCHYFSNFQFSAQEFYSLVTEIIKERKLPDVRISRVEYHEKNIFSNKREYLRIERKDDIFDICAAPFGTGCFVSYWHGEPKKRVREMALKTPYLSIIASGWQGSTFYKIDTANMFKSSVKDSITEAIEQISSTKGVRGLSEAERFAFHA